MSRVLSIVEPLSSNLYVTKTEIVKKTLIRKKSKIKYPKNSHQRGLQNLTLERTRKSGHLSLPKSFSRI